MEKIYSKKNKGNKNNKRIKAKSELKHKEN
jgi:hypothetical protein